MLRTKTIIIKYISEALKVNGCANVRETLTNIKIISKDQRKALIMDSDLGSKQVITSLLTGGGYQQGNSLFLRKRKNQNIILTYRKCMVFFLIPGFEILSDGSNLEVETYNCCGLQ